jgi:hypothetical protein
MIDARRFLLALDDTLQILVRDVCADILGVEFFVEGFALDLVSGAASLLCIDARLSLGLGFEKLFEVLRSGDCPAAVFTGDATQTSGASASKIPLAVFEDGLNLVLNEAIALALDKIEGGMGVLIYDAMAAVNLLFSNSGDVDSLYVHDILLN